jgi:MFS family permease
MIKNSPFLALKFRDFRLLWIGLLISRIGSEMQVVAINWQMYLLTGSALALGVIGLCRFLPILILALPGGIISDKYNRKHVMLFAQISTAFLSLILSVTSFTGHISPLIIYFVLIGNSIATAFDTPARQSMAPSLVPKEYLVNAVSLNTIMWQSAIVIGPSIAGFTIAYLGLSSVYLINAFSFIAVIIALVLMNNPKQIIREDTSFSLKSLFEGLSFVRRSPLIYSTMLLDFIATFFSSATVLLPIFAKDILKVGPEGLGILYAAPAVGAVMAGLFASSLGHFKHQGKILLLTVSLYGAATLGFGLTTSFAIALFLLFLTGVGDVISTIIRNTIRQLTTPDHLRGRMTSINMIFFMGGPQLGEAEAGILAAVVGAPLSVVAGGIGTIIATFAIGILVPKLRRYMGNELVV